MGLLFSLVIIHGQMLRINFFFVSFFSHFFLLWPLAMLCILISWILKNFSPYLASTTAFSKFFHRENCLSVSDWFKMAVALQ